MFIKKAAILYERGGIIEGTNYGDIEGLARRMGITSSHIYGFMDSSDNFIDRNQALDIAKAAKQIPEDFDGPMYPEDLFVEASNATD
jgi:hypothetical protein